MRGASGPGGMSRERFVPPGAARAGPQRRSSAGRSDGSGGCAPRDPGGTGRAGAGPAGPGSRSAPPRSNSSPLKLLLPFALTMRLDLWREMF